LTADPSLEDDAMALATDDIVVGVHAIRTAGSFCVPRGPARRISRRSSKRSSGSRPGAGTSEMTAI
jgi:hypothetical protein